MLTGGQYLERETGLEPAALCLSRRRSVSGTSRASMKSVAFVLTRPETEVNRQALVWERVHNTVRLHQALGYKTPQQFLKEFALVRTP